MEKRARWNSLYLLVALLGVLAVHDVWISARSVEPLSYSAFLQQLKEGNVEAVQVADKRISGTLKHALPDGRVQFATVRVDPALANDLAHYGIGFSAVEENTALREILGYVLPALIFIAAWLFVFRRIGTSGGIDGSFLTIGKSKARVYAETAVKITFDDVAGVDEAKEELQEVVGFLKDPKALGRLGARIPKGVLLVGPPGTGKTLLARAVAGEAGVPFFSINGSEFVEMFVGVGAARVRDLFEQARRHAPAIIFIDEIDALGRARAAYGRMGGHDEKEQTLNQLLAELDGFDPTAGLVLLAATNRPEILDPALLRAGRFDRQVLVARPDRLGRVQILKVHLRKIRIEAGVDIDEVAALTTGFSGADLANLVNEAALLATRRGAMAVALDDFTAAIERIVAGLEKKNRLLNANERRTVAYHEMGHALVAMSLPGTDPVRKISIIPRGIGALGYTIQRPTEDRYLMTRQELEDKMTVLLGGRAAEELVFGMPSTGAADDLVKVTDIARSIVTHYGMCAKLGAIVFDEYAEGDRPHPFDGKPYSDHTAEVIDAAIQQIVNENMMRALRLLRDARAQLEAGAAQLLANETLSEGDIARIAAGLRPARSPGQATALA